MVYGEKLVPAGINQGPYTCGQLNRRGPTDYIGKTSVGDGNHCTPVGKIARSVLVGNYIVV